MWQNARLLLVFILLLSFGVRLGAASYWHRSAQAEERLFRLGDSYTYWTLANQLGQGLPYEYAGPESRIFRAPLYPMVLAPLTWIGEEAHAVWWARVLGCALGTVCVALVAKLAAGLGGECAGLLAAAMAAVYPAAIGMSIMVLSEALFMPLMIAYLLAWQAAWRSQPARQVGWYGLQAGGLAGLAVLARPSWLLFAPFVWGVAMVWSNDRRRHCLIFAATLVGLSLVMAPWWIRNAWITGRFVATTLQVGPSLLDGLHPGASGASDEGMAFMQPIIADQIAEDQLRLAEGSGPLESTLEYRINVRAQREALQWAERHPWETLRLAGNKFTRIWTLWPDGGDVSSTPIRLAITLSSVAVLLLAISFSLTLPGGGGWFYAICWVPSLYFTLLHMVFVGSVRYREPALTVLIAVAACAVARWMQCLITPSSAEYQVAKVNGIATVSPESIQMHTAAPPGRRED